MYKFNIEFGDEYGVDSINIDYLYELKEEKNIDPFKYCRKKSCL